MAGALFGGPLIDRHDRRRLLLIGQIVQAGGSVVLLAAALMHPTPVVLVYVGAALIAGLSGFSLATRSAMTPTLVPTDRLPSALALNQAMWTTAQIVGPAVGGVIVASAGLGLGLRGRCRELRRHDHRGGAHAAASAPRDARRATTRELGRLAAAGGRLPLPEGPQGAPVDVHRRSDRDDLRDAAIAVPDPRRDPVPRRRRDGRAALLRGLGRGPARRARRAAGCTGSAARASRSSSPSRSGECAIAAFGLSGDLLVLAVSCLAVAGGADVVSAVFRSTILQDTVPDDLRGRLSGIHITVVAGGPRIGDAEAGTRGRGVQPDGLGGLRRRALRRGRRPARLARSRVRALQAR